MIKIVQGIYGYKDVNGTITPKTASDEPFSLTDEQEARLVKLGVAKFVKEEEKAEAEVKEKAGAIEEQDSEEKVVEGIIVKDDLENMSYNDLKKLAAQLGVSAEGKRPEIEERIIAAKVNTQKNDEESESEVAPVQQFEADTKDDDAEQPPELKAADPE